MSTATPAPQQNQTPTTIKRFQEETISKVLEKINAFKEAGELRLPANYSPENALKSAFLMLQDTFDRDGNPVLEVCTPASIANALLDMVIKGVSPVKKQCYFIAYGKELACDPSYFGNQVTAKRVGGVKDIKGVAIYHDDVFVYEKDPVTGRNKVLEHKQNLENIDHEKVKGAYAIVTFNDGTIDVEIMSMKQIRQAWMQGATKGNSPAHKNFSDEMAEKTVINRACKSIINTTDDATLFQDDEERPDPVVAGVKAKIADKANGEDLKFEEPVSVTNTPRPEGQEKQQVAGEQVSDQHVNGQGQMKGPGF